MTFSSTVQKLWLCLAVSLVFVLAAPAFGQAISGDLVGTVIDATGAAIPSVNVTATDVATNSAHRSVTSQNGEYRISNLPPGTYTISATAPGFGTATLQNVPVQLNKIATANLTLQIAAATTSVEVVEAPAVIDTTTAQIQDTFTSKESADLPTAAIGSGVLNLSLLESGVASSGGIGIGSGPSVGGQRPRNNNFTVDGVDNNSKSVTGPLLVVPNDSVAEFTLLQNQFSPEYGHSSGGQFNTIVKSGTNVFHGQIYEYNRNRNYNAVDQSFANQGILSLPRYDNNRLGGNIGGPILHNKLFFFADFEYNPIGQSSTSGLIYAPTAAGYASLSGLPGISQTNLGILKQYATASTPATGSDIPVLTVAGTNIPVGIIPIAAPNFQNNYFGVLSSDYNISDRDQLRGRYIYNKYSQIDTSAALPVFYQPIPQTEYLATLAEYHTFSPTLTNELRIGFNRFNQNFPAGNFKYPGLDQFPNIQLNDLGLQIGPDPNAPQFGISNLYQGVDNLTFTWRTHTFKIGTEVRRYIAPQSFTQRARGDYEYTDTALFLTDQTPDYLAERTVGNVIYYGDQLANYDYVNDSWRLRPNLTINLGLRYEYTEVPHSERSQPLNAIANVPGVLTFGVPKAQTKNFAPRIGIAYSPGTSGNTSIRAGFGTAYDVLFDNIGILSLPPELSTTVDSIGLPTPAGGYLASGGIPPTAAGSGPLTAAQARANTSGYIIDQTVPYSISWNFGIQHVFAKNYTFEARYLGTRGVHLPTQVQINKQPKVTADNFIPTFLNAPSAATLAGLSKTLGQINSLPAVSPQFLASGFTSNITTYTAQGWSLYNGLALQLNRRFSNGLQFVGSYTWSHNIDNSTAEFATTYLTPRRAQNGLDLTADKASSALDRRHRFTFTMIYDVPYFRDSHNWFMKNLVGNWEVAPIYTYESPEYFTPQSGVDTNLNGDSAGDRNIINVAGQAGTGSGVYGLDKNGNRVTPSTSKTNPIVAYVALNPNARYIQAQLGALATGGRNTEPTRPINNVDLTLLKRFNITERFHLELMGQAFNAFNHPQFIPGSVNDVGTVGTFAGPIASYVRAANPAFGNPEVAFASNARVIQLVGKISW